MSRPVVIETVAGMREALAGVADVALVPTMGALHEGHLALVDRAAELAGTVVVSIFVNPLQFGPNEDLTRYPRTLDADLEALAGRGVAYVFAPPADEMYPDGGTQVRVTGGPVAATLEGAARPGHFDGVLTVVAKLLGIVRPGHVVFGQKDAQQLFLVQRMVHDLNIATSVDVVETVRAPDGLALSSRNRFLDADARSAALALSRALEAAASSADRGIDAVLAAAQSVLMDEDLVKLDYLKVVDPRTFQPVDDDYRGPARVLIAARVGDTRLIDNESLYLT
ncbi:MAG: pantoate--beta-alanine ligase [Microbacteriaceae bacterium]|nr:pantoate--beta-alanine ligase [Microbacteriaceae bacterium]